jgi:hypothetical protein
MNRPAVTQIGVLVLATSFVQLAVGFFGTFISLRVPLENFTATVSAEATELQRWEQPLRLARTVPTATTATMAAITTTMAS